MKNLTTVILTSNSSKGYKSTEMKQKSSITITIPSDPIVFIIAIEEAGRAVIDKINIICYAYSIVRKMKNLKKI